jgi:hypothetical protein
LYRSDQSSGSALLRHGQAFIEDAESFIARLPSDAVGVIFMEGERAVQPDVNVLDKYQRNPGAPSGFWLRAAAKKSGKSGGLRIG